MATSRWWLFAVPVMGWACAATDSGDASRDGVGGDEPGGGSSQAAGASFAGAKPGSGGTSGTAGATTGGTSTGGAATGGNENAGGAAPLGPCYIGGCSAHVCSDQSSVVTTCEWLPEYACFQSVGICKRQASGNCGWTQTQELMDCLADPPGTW